MSSQEIATAFVLIAEEIQSRDLTDEQLARLIKDDPQFERALTHLVLDLFPGVLQSRLRSPVHRVSKQLTEENLKGKRLSEEAKTVIWRWAEDPDSFFTEISHPAPELATAAASSTAPFFDPVFSLLVRLQTQGQVDRVRWRLLLFFLAHVVNRRIGEVGTPEAMVQMLAEYNWISEPVKKVLREGTKAMDWLQAGSTYVKLVERVGLGGLVCLPFIGESNWNYHSHPDGQRWPEIASLLVDRGILDAALLREKHGNVALNAHEVAERVIKHWSSQCQVDFVAYSPPPARAKKRGETGKQKNPRPRRRGPRRGRAQSVYSASTLPAPRPSPPSGSTFEWELISGQPLAEYPATPSVATPSSLMSHLGDFEHCHVLPSSAF